MQSALADIIGRHKAVAVAVSGGADSMALAHMLAHAAQDTKIHALTVDHGLREESAYEARQVAGWLSHWPQTTHTILHWTGEKPASRRMEAARTARYRLMAQYCIENEISFLGVAHHRDDQAETLLFRLAKGSGADGLSGMRETMPYTGTSVSLWRPLLRVSHDDLVSYCRAHGLSWIEDPSNADRRYARTRLREARGVLAAEGLTPTRLGMTAARLARAQDALDWTAGYFHEKALIVNDEGAISFSMPVLRDLPQEISLRIVREGVLDIRPSAYGPRLAKLETLVSTLLGAQQDMRATLAGCLFEYRHSHAILKIRREKEA